MTKRYEIKDSNYPTDRGMRFESLNRARQELSHAIPRNRFYILDRETKQVIGDDNETCPKCGAPAYSTTAETFLSSGHRSRVVWRDTETERVHRCN